MEIICQICLKAIKIPSYYDTDDFEGQIFCGDCQLLYNIKLKKGKLFMLMLKGALPEARVLIKYSK